MEPQDLLRGQGGTREKVPAYPYAGRLDFGPAALLKRLLAAPQVGAATGTGRESMDEDDDSTLDLEDFPIACPKCSVQMRLFAIEWETERRDLYTFICDWCGHAVARGVSMQ
jgi:hypothetical protein